MTDPYRAESATSRRGFLKGMALAAGSLLPFGMAARVSASEGWSRPVDRARVRALLISATTLTGRKSLEHAAPSLLDNYEDAREILLINFASLPQDRDAYEERMRRDLSGIDKGFRVRSLHRASRREAANWVRQAEGFFVSGGNTFLLLRELYDLFVVETLRERVLNGIPYAGSSAGSNIAGIEIGTTNDFPICDVPTRRSLGLYPGLYNPHHPEEAEEKDFSSRQWKIGQYCRLRPDETVIGVTNPGMLELKGSRIRLLGEGAAAYVQKGERKATVRAEDGGLIDDILEEWIQKA